MPDQLEYVVKGAMMLCDKGAAPGFLIQHITHILKSINVLFRLQLIKFQLPIFLSLKFVQ